MWGFPQEVHLIDTAITSHSISRFLVPGLFVLLLVLEFLSPRRRIKQARGRRYVVNAALTGLGFLTGVLAVRPAALGGALWAERNSLLPFSSTWPPCRSGSRWP